MVSKNAKIKSLQKIVVLRRQKAEQALWRLQAQAQGLDQEIIDNRCRLRAIASGTLQPLSVQLSEGQNYSSHILARIESLRAEQLAIEPRLNVAKHALKRAIFSESQLDLLSVHTAQ